MRLPPPCPGQGRASGDVLTDARGPGGVWPGDRGPPPARPEGMPLDKNFT